MDSGNRKKVIIITVSNSAGQLYRNILEQFISSDLVEFELYDRDALLSRESIPDADLYVVSKGTLEYLGEFEQNLHLGIPVVDIRVAFQREDVKVLEQIPDNTQCMFVNETEPLAMECIVELYRNSVYNIHLVPFWPGKEVPAGIDTAITAGAIDVVPEHVKHVYNLGIRHLAPHTVAEVCTALDMGELLLTDTYLDYLNRFTLPEQSSRYFYTNSLHYKASIDTLIESSNDAIVGINEGKRIFCINKNALALFRRTEKECYSRHYKLLMPFLDYEEFSSTALEGQRWQKLYDYGGTVLDTSIHAIVDGGKFRGIMIRLQRYTDEEDQLHDTRRKLMNKGHKAKYTFDDIITGNPVMKSLCVMAARMAETNSSVLISGESGTGKELLASAIHNASGRAQYPYIAINCAAMPESLLESELFGYDEGAFTGARKNGKPGLFEHAHRGTIFLDEIEDMSPMLQVKLLRVLQEKEVMRIGGAKLISVDVRIIAATNENLEHLVQSGQFRKDLYYRLNTLQLSLPPLRERKDDIPLLLEYFRRQGNFDFSFSQEVMNLFYRHQWEGNIRELRNYMEYLQFVNQPVIQLKDLPPQLVGAAGKMGRGDFNPVIDTYENHESYGIERIPETGGGKSLNEDELFILSCLHEAHKQRIHAGRKILSEMAAEQDRHLSEQMIRRILKDLELKGLVTVSRGRAGSRLTLLGMEYFER